MIDEVIEDLKKKGYLDDKEFIRAFVAEKSKFKNWSIKKIKSELIKSGLASKLIDEILSKEPSDSDSENAMKLARKNMRFL